jgi:hypothetical protein
MPVVLVTQEAEIKRITVQSQPGQIVCDTLPQKYTVEGEGGGGPNNVYTCKYM